MRHFPSILLIAALALGLGPALTGCDSDDGDDTPAEERIVGVWAAETASLLLNPLGTAIPVLEEGDEASVTISFETTGEFLLTVQGPVEFTAPITGEVVEIIPEGEATATRGTYEVVADEEQIRFTATTVDGIPVIEEEPADVDFGFRGDDLTLTIENDEDGQALLAFLLGSDELAALFQGGEARFEQITASTN